MIAIIPTDPTPAPLHLIEYGDFSCPRCQELQTLLTTTLPLFSGAVCYTFRHFPNPAHPQALLMALAAEAARRQDRYWVMHQALFTYRAPVSLDSVSSLSARLGLEPEVFQRDMHDKTLEQRVRADMELGRLAQVVSTPTLFLGIRRLHGKLTQARLTPLIRHYVARTNTPVRSALDPKREWIG